MFVWTIVFALLSSDGTVLETAQRPAVSAAECWSAVDDIKNADGTWLVVRCDEKMIHKSN